MDTAVGLVEAYLYANGFFTVTEHPIIEELPDGGYRSVTDVDVLAIRLPGAGGIAHREGTPATEMQRLVEPDPLLIDADGDDWIDLIIGEVKEGKASFNPGARRSNTLMAALRRFAFLEQELADDISEQLIRKGRARLEDRKIQIRLFAFGSRFNDRLPRSQQILLKRCLKHLVRLGRLESTISATQIKNPTLSLLALLAKSGFIHVSNSGKVVLAEETTLIPESEE